MIVCIYVCMYTANAWELQLPGLDPVAQVRVMLHTCILKYTHETFLVVHSFKCHYWYIPCTQEYVIVKSRHLINMHSLSIFNIYVRG